MATMAEKLLAAANKKREQSGTSGTIKPWLGTENNLKGQIVLGRFMTLETVLALGADPAKVLAALDLRPTKTWTEDMGSIVREELEALIAKQSLPKSK